MTDARYIGGEFCRVDDETFLAGTGDADSYFPANIRGTDRSYFETGSDSLAAILESCGEAEQTLWIPENHCRDGIRRTLQKLAVPPAIRRYPGNQPIIGELKSGDALLFIHFNRFDKIARDEAHRTAQEAGAILIEDYVQAPLDIRGLKGRYAFNSLRKFAALEVSVAYGKGLRRPQAGASTEYHGLRKRASELKSLFRAEGKKSGEEAYLQLYREAEASLHRNGEIAAAQEEEAFRLGRLLFQAMERARSKNHRHLAELLRNMSVRPVPGGYMYFMLRAGARDALKRAAFEQGIFPAVHWLDSASADSMELLSFHIDHRYGPADMERIAVLLNAFGFQEGNVSGK